LNTDLSQMLTALRAIAEPTRLRIVALCRTGDLTVNELCRALGQSQPRTSRHLKLLVDAGVLEKLPEGVCVFHRLTRSGIGAEVARNISGLIPDDDVLRNDQNRMAQIKQEREARAAEYFTNNAAEWDTLRAMHVDDQEVEEMVLSLLAGKNLGDLLDIGTGTGRMLEVLAPYSERVEGIDSSRSMLAIARATIGRLNLEHSHVRHGDMYDLPFPAHSYDTVLFHQVLHYVDDPVFAVEEAVRVMRPGGRMLIVDFAPHDIEDLRRDHAHRRLGFPVAEINGWFEGAGLHPTKTRNLKGTRLTVSLWMADKPAGHTNDSNTDALPSVTSNH